MKYTWNDAVRIMQSAPGKFRPGQYGVVCGMRCLDANQEIEGCEVPSGTEVYIVEWSDGNSLEIPEYYLSPFTSDEEPSE